MPHSVRHTITALATLALIAATAGCASSGKRYQVGPTVLEAPNTAKAVTVGADADDRLRNGEHAEAYEGYIECLRHDREFYPCWNNLGTLLMQEEAYQEAYDAFSIASSLRPDEPRPEYNIGLLFTKRRHLKEALDHYLKALDRDPEYLPALRSAIVTVVDLRRPSQEALGWLRRAQFLETDPDWLEYYQTHKLRFESQLADPQR